MTVGQTYEMHWYALCVFRCRRNCTLHVHNTLNFAHTPTLYIICRPHSTKGACNTPWQYQTPFYDGVFCNLPVEEVLKLQPQDIASNVGVQSQTFVVVDDEDYYYPDLFRGMIIDEDTGHGVDLAIYTGSSKLS